MTKLSIASSLIKVTFVIGILLSFFLGCLVGSGATPKTEVASPTEFDGLSFTVHLPDGMEVCISANVIPSHSLNNSEKAFLIKRLRNAIEDVTFEEWKKYQ